MPAVGWLLDHCPSDYRMYAVWRRHPLALAWVTTHHLDGQLGAMRTAYRGLRVDLADHVEPEGIAASLAALEAEAGRLRLAPELSQVVNNSEVLTDRARIRVQLSAAHSEDDVRACVEAFVAALLKVRRLLV